MRTLMLARLTGSDQGWRLPMNYEPPPGSGPRFGVVGLVPCMVGGTKISHEEKGTKLNGEMVKRANVSV